MANYDVGELVDGLAFSDGSGYATFGSFVQTETTADLRGYFPELGTKIVYPNWKTNIRAYEEIGAVEYLTSGGTYIYPTDVYPILTIKNNLYVGVIARASYETRLGYEAIVVSYTYDPESVTESNPKGLSFYQMGILTDIREYPYANYFMILANPSTDPEILALYPYVLAFSINEISGSEVIRNKTYEDLTIGRRDGYVYRPTTVFLRYQDSDGNIVGVQPDDVEDVPSDSGTGGGGGDYNPTSDPINLPTLPNLSAVGSGMITLYNPTTAQLNALGGYLWSGSEDFFDNLSKMWNDPMSALVSLGIFPLAPNVGSVGEVKIGSMRTGVSMPILASQYKQFDCGSLDLTEYFGSALDYNPYSKVSIFIPFCGVQSLNIDDVMGSTLRLVYNVDMLTGAFACVLKVTRKNLDSVLYHFSGNMMTPLPMSSNDFSGLYNSVVQMAGGILSVASGNVTGGTLTVASSVLGQKESIGRSGSISGNSGLMDNMTPYLIVERPIQSLANGYKHFVGYPSNITYTLGGLSGYTEIESVISNTLTCPQIEQDEIIDLLKGGVYL